MRREILAIVVHCTFKDDGCIWKGEVRHLEVTYVEEPLMLCLTRETLVISKHRGELKIERVA